MTTNLKVHVNENYKKAERLAYIKERYRKLILEPRKEIESEMAKDLEGEYFDNSAIVNHS